MTDNDAFSDELCETGWTSVMASTDGNHCYNDFIRHSYISLINIVQ